MGDHPFPTFQQLYRFFENHQTTLLYIHSFLLLSSGPSSYLVA